MFGQIFEAGLQLMEDTVDILAAPVVVVTEVAAAAVKPGADGLRDVVDDLKHELR
jgi:hypothetical protein